MSVHTYKITVKQQITLLGPAFMTAVAFIAICLYYFKTPLSDSSFYLVFGFVLCFDTLPSIALHIQYLIKNWKASLTIDTGKRQLTYESNQGICTYFFDNIRQLIYYRTYGKGAGVNSFSMYRYYKIVFNDGYELNISCLMINQMENTLELLLRIEAEKYFRLLNLI